jgi:hypothetical protein
MYISRLVLSLADTVAEDCGVFLLLQVLKTLQPSVLGHTDSAPQSLSCGIAVNKSHAAVKSVRTHARTFPARNYTHITDKFTVTTSTATDCNYSQPGICSLPLTQYTMWSGRQCPAFRRTLLEIFLYWDFRHQRLSTFWHNLSVPSQAGRVPQDSSTLEDRTDRLSRNVSRHQRRQDFLQGKNFTCV